MARILVCGVNPFEDLPGFQVLGLLQAAGKHHVIAADDSPVATGILGQTGADVRLLPHPLHSPEKYLGAISQLCSDERCDLILPCSDAHLVGLVSGLSMYPNLQQLYPPLEWLSERRFLNKWVVQEWLSGFFPTPVRHRFEEASDLRHWEHEGEYPVMVKGMRKGASRCADSLEVLVARREILRNSANCGANGGAYLEQAIEGEEHSFFCAITPRGIGPRVFSFKKLAVTRFGTTVVGEVGDLDVAAKVLAPVIREVRGPAVLEIEGRVDTTGKLRPFEVNFRFPSWVGALGEFGSRLVSSFVDDLLGEKETSNVDEIRPEQGSLFYRLPQSGFLSIAESFPTLHRAHSQRTFAEGPGLLWGGSPHEFLVK